MRRAICGTVAAIIAIAASATVLAAHGRQSVTFDVSDRPLFTLEQQRELAIHHRTAVNVFGDVVIFEWEGTFPEELKPYMWGYPE